MDQELAVGWQELCDLCEVSRFHDDRVRNKQFACYCVESPTGDPAMPRYFFHTQDDDQVIEDDIGLHLSDLGAVKAAAARSLAELALDVLPGCDERRIRVDVYDEEGRQVLTTELVFKVLVAVS